MNERFVAVMTRLLIRDVLGLLYVIGSLSSVCNVRAPYSGD